MVGGVTYEEAREVAEFAQNKAGKQDQIAKLADQAMREFNANQ